MKKVREEAVKMFMVLMFTLLPLYYSDNYYNILNDKRDIYWLFSRILFVVIAVSLCISLMLVIKNHQFSKNMRTQLQKNQRTGCCDAAIWHTCNCVNGI